MVDPNGNCRRESLAGLVRIAVGVLGSARIARELINKPPRFMAEERPSFWLSVNENSKRRVLYTIRLARMVAERYGLPLEGFGDFRFVDLDDSSAARVTTRGSSYYIEIDNRYRNDRYGILSILAHEFSHVFLAKHGILMTPRQQDEELTDTIAVLAGFGPILKKTCERVHTQSFIFVTITKTHYLGYLRRKDLAWLGNIRARIRSQKPYRLWSFYNPEALSYLPCPACTSHLRLPRQAGSILIKCPRCGLMQRLRLAPGSHVKRRSLLSRALEVFRRYLDAHIGILH